MPYFEVPFPAGLTNVQFLFRDEAGAELTAWSGADVAEQAGGWGYDVTTTPPEGAAQIRWRASEVVGGETIAYRAEAPIEGGGNEEVLAAINELPTLAEINAGLDLTGATITAELSEEQAAQLATVEELQSYFQAAGPPPLAVYSFASVPAPMVVVGVKLGDMGVTGAANNIKITAKAVRKVAGLPITADGVTIEKDGETSAYTGKALAGHEDDYPATDNVAWLKLYPSNVLRDTAGNTNFPYTFVSTGTSPTFSAKQIINEPGMLILFS